LSLSVPLPISVVRVSGGAISMTCTEVALNENYVRAGQKAC
jgi:hypothetical protein